MIYTVKELAEKLGKSEETIRRWCKSGKLNAKMTSKKEGFMIDYDGQCLNGFEIKTNMKNARLVGQIMKDAGADIETIANALELTPAQFTSKLRRNSISLDDFMAIVYLCGYSVDLPSDYLNKHYRVESYLYFTPPKAKELKEIESEIRRVGKKKEKIALLRAAIRELEQDEGKITSDNVRHL